MLGERRRCVHRMGPDEVHRRDAVDRQLAGQHLVEENSQRIEVGASVERESARLFRREVCRCADDHAGGSQLRHRALAGFACVEDLCNTDVHDLDPVGGVLAAEQNVWRLEVAMDDAVAVRLLERVGDLLGDEQGAIGLEATALPDLVAERGVAAMLHGEEELPVLELAEVVQAHEVLVVERR